ncbi:MAG: hypothetical protein ACRC5H_10175 [Treponemataceae bacterium]
MKKLIVPVICILTMFSMISCDFNEDDNSSTPTPTPKPTPTPTWEQVGDEVAVTGAADSFPGKRTLKVINNTLYASYHKSSKVIVKKLGTDNKWVQVGEAIVSSSTGLNKLSSDSAGIPYIAVTTDKRTITLYKLVDDKWIQEGEPIQLATEGDELKGMVELAFKSTTPFITYVYQHSDQVIMTMQSYTNGTWTPIISEVPVAKLIALSMISVKDEVYVAYKNTNKKIIVKDSTGTDVGSAIDITTVTKMHLFADESNLYIGYNDNAILKLLKFDSSWVDIEETAVVDNTWLSIGIDKDGGNIYVAYETSVKKLNVSSKNWSTIGSISSRFPVLTVKDNTPYILTYEKPIIQEGSSEYTLYVKKPIN